MGAGGEASTFCVLSRSVLSISLRPHGQWPTRLLCPWGFSRQEYWSGLPCHPPGDLPNRGIKHRCPALLVDSLPSELPRKPMNTEVGSLSLLQGIFRIFSSWLFRIYKPIPYSYPWEFPSRVICFLFRRRVRSV